MENLSKQSSGMLTYRDVVARSKRRTDICEHLTRLYRLTADLPVRDKVVVELGVRHGESTTALIAAVNDSGGHLYSADIVDCSGVHRGEPNWTFILGDDMDIVKEWNRLIDHLFIDSGHTYERTLAKLREWGRWVKLGGIITLHDTNALHYPDVPRAIEKYLEEHPSYGYVEHPERSGLGVIRKAKMRNIPQEYWDNCRLYQYDIYTKSRLYPARYQEITTQLNELKPKPRTLLEIGCFTGYGMNILEDKGFEVYGIDIFKKGLEARVNDNIVKASVESLPFADKSFDAVISADVLEHIHRSGVKEALKEMDRVGKVNVHRIHMKGFNDSWEGGFHVTVEPVKFWLDLLEELRVKRGHWYLYHKL